MTGTKGEELKIDPDIYVYDQIKDSHTNSQLDCSQCTLYTLASHENFEVVSGGNYFSRTVPYSTQQPQSVMLEINLYLYSAHDQFTRKTLLVTNYENQLFICVRKLYTVQTKTRKKKLE